MKYYKEMDVQINTQFLALHIPTKGKGKTVPVL
jgi:hypothetical protein